MSTRRLTPPFQRRKGDKNMGSVINPTGKQIAETLAKNSRWAKRQALLKWGRSEQHPLFDRAKAAILTAIKENTDEEGYASIYYLRRFVERRLGSVR